MKARLLWVVLFVAGLILLSTWAVSAQGPKPTAVPVPPPGPAQPPFLGGALYTPADLASNQIGGDGKPFPIVLPPSRAPASPRTRAAFPLGAPGLSFRYSQTFGQSEVAYFDDSSHLNRPFGLAFDGTNLWITEVEGLRALKFTTGGALLQQIGKAGFRQGTGSKCDFDDLAGIAVDSGSNIWIVDSHVNQVCKFSSSGTFLSSLGTSWSWGSDNAHFNGPYGIAIDSAGNVYVSDTYNYRIQIFNSSGSYVTTIGTGSSGAANNQFNFPYNIAVDSSNNLYVADVYNHRVQIFDSSHAYVATIGVTGVPGSGSNQFNQPTGVAVDPSKIYVTDWGNCRVQIFDRTTRAYQNTIGGTCGNANNQFLSPADVVLDAAGNIYVADQYNFRVQEFNSALIYVRTFGTTGVPYLTDSTHFNQPSGTVVAPDGSSYVVEARGHRLIKLNAAGTPQWTLGIAGRCTRGSGGLCSPNGVALDPSGRVYVASSGNNRIPIFNPDSSYFGTLGAGYGTANDQFNNPNGVAVDSAGNVYVADTYNHRVQVFNSGLSYVATLGVTGVPGSDNAHFSYPRDVAVDATGNLYIADTYNHRVQVFNSSLGYVRTIGETGVCNPDYGHFCNPVSVAVDTSGRVYVGRWGSELKIYDNSGAFLTEVGGSWTSATGGLRQVEGIGVDGSGNLYAADMLNHRIQKYAIGVPGWAQTNLDGFGDYQNQIVTSLSPFGGALYAGTYNYGGNGAQLWRLGPGSTWSSVITPGFGITRNVGIDHLFPFNNRLYAGIWADTVVGGQVWRSDNGTNWNQMTLPGFDTTNGEVFRFAAFNNKIYASTWSYTNTHGVEIWRSDTGDSGAWTRVVSNGFNNDPTNVSTPGLTAFNGFLYAGTYNWNSALGASGGGQVWRTGDGTTWNQVNVSGFGSADNFAVQAFVDFNGYLYASSGNRATGGKIWRCAICDGSDWNLIIGDGFGNPNNRAVDSMFVFNNTLYVGVPNNKTGMEIWRSSDGTTWSRVSSGGFGSSNNAQGYWDNAVTVFNNQLYYGLNNRNNGGQVWQTENLLYLPLIMR